MKIQYFLFFLFFSTTAFCQGEASNWYFGDYAGVSFSTGFPVALTDMPMVFGQNLKSEEGCTSISDSAGNLLFYTNGTMVWDRTHEVMFNGFGLHGDQSSTQSAIIVPKPGSNTNYYIFTVDEHNTNDFGLEYSEVDMSLNGGLGDLVAVNIHLLDHCTEKITAVKSFDCSEIWVIAYSSVDGITKGNYNTFFSYQISASGIQPNPIQSTVPVPSITDGRGYMKVSADGTKLAIAHQGNGSGGLYLYNFNKQTGVVSNQTQLIMSNPGHANNNSSTQPYGLEFSLSTNKLYVTSTTASNQGYLWQFDLVAHNVKLISYQPNNSFRGALQMAPDSKIYRSLSIDYDNGSRYLGVINNPEATGIACNYQHDAIDLDPNNEGRRSRQGLPPFIQSLFLNQIDIISPNSADIDTDLDLCTGETYQLTGPIIANATYAWYVDDVLITPYSLNYLDVTINVNTTVVYKLIIDKNDGSCPIEGEASVTYHPLTVNSPIALKQCDDDTDGVSNFNLTEKNSFISANSANETFTYYTTPTAANTEDITFLIANPTAYTSSNSTVWVRVENSNGCFRVAQLNLAVSATQLPATFHPSLYVCDDFLDINGDNNAANNNSDGISAFNLNTGVSTLIQNILPPPATAYNIKYYKNEPDALAETNEITNITNYRNIGFPNTQEIWVRVDSSVDNACFGFSSITLTVETVPTANPVTINRQCDNNHDGIYPFDTSSILSTILNGQTNVSVTYYNQNNTIIPTGLPNQLPNPFNTASQTITIRVTNNATSVTTGACYDETTLSFIVDEFPIANSIVIPPVCDDEINPADADGLFAFDSSTYQSMILGNQTGMVVTYFDGNGNSLPSPLPNPFITGTQDVTAIVENPLNLACPAQTTLHFTVNPVPNIELVYREQVCTHQTTFTTTLDAGIRDNTPTSDYTYQWSFEGTILTGETHPTLTVNTEGIYSVEVTNAFGCSRVRTITVVHSSGAIIQDIDVIDLVENNTVSVYLTSDSLGDYVYSLNQTNAFQTSNIFNNVPPGIHIVYVKDLNGCEIVSQTISVIGVPPYFTPNGDGFNDYWNVKGVGAFFNRNSTIYVFDRYGKLLKQIKTTDLGWDGTFNGKPMPSTDYWYAVYLEDGRIAKGHFALKR